MVSSVTLYSWAVPAFTSGSPVDHTWVTTYDNGKHPYASAKAVVAAKENYWFCWGDFHPAGGTPGNVTGFLGSQSGDPALAKCLVLPNADSRNAPAARGTIFIYAVDGVCHQLANQALYATGKKGPQLTVKAARGYIASTFIYGTFGLQHAAWAAKVQGCGGASTLAAAPQGGVMKMHDLPDDFESHARSVLGDTDAALLSKLLALKGEVHAFAMLKAPGFTPPDAATINARNQHLIDQAAILLGPEKFESVFGFPAGVKISLADPSLMPAPAKLRR